MHQELLQHWKNILLSVTIHRWNSTFLLQNVIYGRKLNQIMSKNSIIPSCRVLDISTYLLNKTEGVMQISFKLKAAEGYSFEITQYIQFRMR